jgi:hypothetical protein
MVDTAHEIPPQKVILYTTFGGLFGGMCRSWRDALERGGHAAEVLDLRNEWQGPLPVVDGAGVNIHVGGTSLLRIVGRHGLPRTGKNVLWVFEPLTDDPASEKHYHKSLLLTAVARRFDAFIGMDDRVVAYLRAHYPDVPTFWIPYTIDREAITPPVAEDRRRIDILWLARLARSARRRAARDWFRRAGLAVRLVRAGLYGAARDRVIARSRLNLEVHGDHVHYTDQCRMFLAWAGGAVVVSEPCEHFAAFGIEDGVHLVTAELDRFPEVCRELLGDPARRGRIARAAQQLLRDRYSTERWTAAMREVVRTV